MCLHYLVKLIARVVVENYQNQTTISQLIANNMSEYFFSETRCTTGVVVPQVV